MTNMIAFFIRRPKVVNLIMLFLFMIGLLSMFKVQNQGYPSVDFGVVNISTIYPGASAEDVEVKVTAKIEDELKSIAGVESMQSASMENWSQISLILEENADYDKAVNDIQKAVDKVRDFPREVVPPIVTEINNERIPVFEIAIIGDASYALKRKYALALDKKLLADKKVGSVSKYGYLKREVQIKADPLKLNKAYLSLSSLSDAIRLQNIRLSAGDTTSKYNQKKIVLDSEIKDVSDVKNIIVRSGFDGNRVRISDVAEVVDGFEKADKLFSFQGQESINVIAFKKENADILETVESIHVILEEFRTTLPKGVQAEIIIDYSKSVKDLLSLVKNNAVIGLFFVLLVLFIFLNFRAAFWTAIGIPLSIFFAFALFPYFDISINFITLMALIIVLGLLVDDAIVVAENIYSYREKGLEPIDAAIAGTKEVMWPVITTVLTTIIAFSPLLAMTGVMGKFMWQMPVVVSLVLAGSLAECLFLLPSHMAHTKIDKRKENKTNLMDKFGDVYERFVNKAMRYRWLTFAIFLVMFLSSIFMLTNMKFILFGSDEGEFAFIKFETKVGTSLEETQRRAHVFEDVLSTYSKNEVGAYVTTIGQKIPKIEEQGSNIDHGAVGNVVIHIAPVKYRDRSAQEIIDDIKANVVGFPGFERIEADMIQEGPPVGRAVTLTVISNNDKERGVFVQQVKDFLHAQKGVSKIEDNEGEGKQSLKVKINHDLASRLGLNATDIAQVLRTAFDGQIVSTLRRGGEELDFRVQLQDGSRLSEKSIRQLKLSNKETRLIPISQLIELEKVDDLLMVNHYDGDRSVSIYADVDTEVQTSMEINKSIKETFVPMAKALPDLRIEFGGEEKNTEESMNSLAIAMVLALLGIYSILVVLFNSFSQPLLVMIAIPFTFSGIIYTFVLHGMPFGFMAILGMIGLTGIVVNDALVMISMLNSCRDTIGDSIDDLAFAARRRLRPILITTLTTAAGLFPTAYGWGGENAFIIPMILSIAWGLVFATIITLILVPSLYVMQGASKKKSL